MSETSFHPENIDSHTGKFSSIHFAPFVEEFSQEHSQTERADLADDILAMKDEAEQNRYDSDLLTAEWQKIDSELENLDQNKNLGIQLKKHFLLKALRQRINELNQSPLADKKDKIPALRAKISQAIIETTRSGQSNESRQAQIMINDFYRHEVALWTQLPYDKEEIKKYFTADYLSQLPLNDYITLLQRFPASFTTHVTRQGIRDHIGMMWHSSGKGEFTSGFQELISTPNKRIKSPLEIWILEQPDLPSRLQAIGINVDKDSYQQAIQKLDYFVNPSSAPGDLRDRAAIHFGSNRVMDDLYGAESNNEVFYLFPSLLIANDYLFGGNAPLVYQDPNSEYSQWNDVFVWQKDKQGISLDSGIVFLPKSTLVDQQTGSQYALDQKKQSFIDSESPNVAQLQAFFATSEAQNYFSQEMHYPYDRAAANLAKEQLISLASQKFPKFSVAFREIFDSKNGLNHLLHSQEKNNIERFLADNIRYFWQKPDPSQTIPAQTYWENYFSAHPDQKPNKIVYYDGDPNRALDLWKQNNFLHDFNRLNSDFGFSENTAASNEEQISAFAETVRQQLQLDIDSYYQQHPSDLSDSAK